MKNTPAITALLAFPCLICSAAPATAQGALRSVGLTADTLRLRAAVAGQPFPYAAGVSMELDLYRRVRRAGLLADTALASQAQRIDALSAELATSRRLYANCAGARAEAEQASDRQADALAALGASYKQLEVQRQRAAWAPFTPATAGALLLGLVVGVYLTR